MNYINPFNQLSGIYRILNKINGNCYIGSSLNVEKDINIIYLLLDTTPVDVLFCRKLLINTEKIILNFKSYYVINQNIDYIMNNN